MQINYNVVVIVIVGLWSVGSLSAYVKDRDGIFNVLVAYDTVSKQGGCDPSCIPGSGSKNLVKQCENVLSGGGISLVGIVHDADQFREFVAASSMQRPVLVKVFVAQQRGIDDVHQQFQRLAEEYKHRCSCVAMDMDIPANHEIVSDIMKKLSIEHARIPLFILFYQRRPIAVLQGTCPPDLIHQLCSKLEAK